MSSRAAEQTADQAVQAADKSSQLGEVIVTVAEAPELAGRYKPTLGNPAERVSRSGNDAGVD